MRHVNNHKRTGAVRITGATVLIAILAAALFYIYFYGVPQQAIVPNAPQLPTGSKEGDFINMNVGFIYGETNAKSGAALSTSSAAYVAFNPAGRRLASVTTLYGETGSAIASGSTATNVPVFKSDNGYLFINFDTGTTDVPDPVKIKASNPAITECKWIPVTSATVNELVCELDISELGNPNYEAGTTSVSTSLKVIGIPDDNSATISNPADQSSIGTTANTDVYITWEFTALASNQAHIFARLYVTSNQTSSEIDVRELTVSYDGGIVIMSDYSRSYTTYVLSHPRTSGTAAGVTQTWKFWPTDRDDSADISEAMVLARGASDIDSIRVTAHISFSVTTSGHGVTAVLNYRFISAANALSAVSTDSVALSA